MGVSHRRSQRNVLHSEKEIVSSTEQGLAPKTLRQLTLEGQKGPVQGDLRKPSGLLSWEGTARGQGSASGTAPRCAGWSALISQTSVSCLSGGDGAVGSASPSGVTAGFTALRTHLVSRDATP